HDLAAALLQGPDLVDVLEQKALHHEGGFGPGAVDLDDVHADLEIARRYRLVQGVTPVCYEWHASMIRTDNGSRAGSFSRMPYAISRFRQSSRMTPPAHPYPPLPEPNPRIAEHPQPGRGVRTVLHAPLRRP